MKHYFKTQIYKTGINWCVDVPLEIAQKMTPEKGYIKIKGEINGYSFTQTLVPVKNAPYRLFVNLVMMKGGKTALGEVAAFIIEQDKNRTVEEDYPVPELLLDQLNKNDLLNDFNNLTSSRRKDILRYLNSIKKEETLRNNIEKVIRQLHDKHTNVRVP